MPTAAAACKGPLTRRAAMRYAPSGAAAALASRTTMQQHPLTLGQLAVGESAQIVGYRRGDRTLRDRLLSLGLTRGTRVRLNRAGPTGCPIELHARGCSLVLRRSEAAALHVVREPAS